MISIDPEIQAYRLFETKIQEICRLNWRFLEYEDRISEAAYIFIIALRTLPTNTGFFWHEYQNVLMDYMQSLKKEYQHQTCWLKLDAPVRSICDSYHMRNHDQYGGKTMNTRLDITQLYDLFFKDYPDVLSTKDAMEILQISDKTLYRLLHSGQLKSIRIRNSFRIPKLFLLQYLGIVSEDEL